MKQIPESVETQLSYNPLWDEVQGSIDYAGVYVPVYDHVYNHVWDTVAWSLREEVLRAIFSDTRERNTPARD